MSDAQQQHRPGDVVNGRRLTDQPDGSRVWVPIEPEPQPVDSDPQHKPGDVVNGHRLTEQPDGSLAWLPVGAEPKKNKRPIWPWFGIAAVLLLLLALIIGVMNRPDRADDAANESDLTPGQIAEREAASEEPEPEPTPEPAPAPELGTFDNPAPAGTSITSTGWDGTSYDTSVASVNFNANAAVAEANQFNDAAPAGFHYVVVTYTVTNNTADAAKGLNPGAAVLDMSVVDAASGTSYSPEFGTVLNNNMSGQNEIFAGQSATGDVAYLIPDSVSSMYIASGGVFVIL